MIRIFILVVILGAILFSIYKLKENKAQEKLDSSNLSNSAEKAKKEIEENILLLNKSYQANQMRLIRAISHMRDTVIPSLELRINTLTQSAKDSKEKYLKSSDEIKELHRSNSIKYLKHSLSTQEQLMSAKDTLNKLENALESGKARYDSSLADLELALANIESSVSLPECDKIEFLSEETKAKIKDSVDKVNIESEIAKARYDIHNADEMDIETPDEMLNEKFKNL